MQSILVFLGLIAVFLAAAVWLGKVNEHREAQQLEKKLRSSFGTMPSKRISVERRQSIPAYYRRHQSRRSIDDITWNDLDMDAVYGRLDATQSAAGEEYLYYLLRTPAWSSAELGVAEDAIVWLGEPQHEKTRLSLQILLHRLGHTGRFSLLDYLDQLDTLGKRSSARDWAALVLPLVCIGIMFLSVPVGLVLLVGVLIWNLLSYLSSKREIEPYLVSFRYILRLLRLDEQMAALSGTAAESPSLSRDLDKMRQTLALFTSFRRGSWMLMSGTGSGSPLDILMDYIRMLFHLDLIKFNRMLDLVRKRRKDLDQLLTMTGRVDAEIAIASFRQSLPYWCCRREGKFKSAPDGALLNRHRCRAAASMSRSGRNRLHDFSRGCRKKRGTGYKFAVEELYHPLLRNPVANSLSGKRPVLLTGSNASGKSTFLKAVALAALLGQTINTVCARSYQGGWYRIYTSMALRDNIREGDSYFMVEIKSLKRIVDAAKDPQSTENPVLCCIDEVLRGTNTIERIAASSEILEEFAENGVLCFAATHDIELSDLLCSWYDNYHFEETLRDNPVTGRQDVVFSYLLHPGRAASRNAIRLLSATGFDARITEKAEERAERFEETGVWE